MSGEAVAGKGLSAGGGMGAIAAAEQQDTEGLPSWPRGCRVRSISTEKKAVGSPPTSGPPEKATEGIIPGAEHFPDSAGSQGDQSLSNLV